MNRFHLALAFSLVSCPARAQTPTALQRAPQTRVEWDKTSLHLVARDGNYARIIRLRGGDLLCGYGDGRGAWVKRSRDNGRTWGEGLCVAPKMANANFANAEFLPLRNGDLLFFCNLRPFKKQTQTPPLAFAIGVSHSTDNGAHWSSVELVHRAGTRFADGCWEPSGLQLPSGEVQLFFADEGPFTESDEQQISLLRSFDNGLHWGAPEVASFRAHYRDGMPVPVRLPGGNTVIAIEDNGLSGTFKPAIVEMAPSDNGTGAVAGAARWGALQTPLAPQIYAGAPYLRVLKSGETILSFQQADDGELEGSQMVVALGDKTAHNFSGMSRPFKAFKTSSQLWNSLFLKDNGTVTAITSTKIGDLYGVWTIDGTVVRS